MNEKKNNLKTFHLLVRCTSQKVCASSLKSWRSYCSQEGEETAQIGSDISAWDTSQKFQLLTCEMEKLKETTVVLFTKTKMLAWGAITQLLMRVWKCKTIAIFRNKRFMLNEMIQRKPLKFAIFDKYIYIYTKNQGHFFHFSFCVTLFFPGLCWHKPGNSWGKK